jgi:hypothetical protein
MFKLIVAFYRYETCYKWVVGSAFAVLVRTSRNPIRTRVKSLR